MASRVCIESGCGVITSSTRCTEHERKRDRARGSRQARGYGAEHERLRAAWQRRLDAGEAVECWRCAEQGRPHLIDPADWQLGHDDRDRSRYRGPECAAGNQATAGRLR